MDSRKKLYFNSLEDFLISKELSVDAELDDGLGAEYPVKGREIEATILFADMSLFSKRTIDLTPTATLIYVNRFFTWITNEALKGIPCIIDKYIGDQMMIVFSNEFGSEDHFVEAVHAARWFAERDILGFHPHMGIASGLVTVGYVGTPLRYNCSVFGKPVTIASRCANIKVKKPNFASIVFPSALWKAHSFSEHFKSVIRDDLTIGIGESTDWKELPAKPVKMKNIGNLEVTSIVKVSRMDIALEVDKENYPETSLLTKEEAEKDLRLLADAGKYLPISDRKKR